jgi:hypothetical protein
MLGFFTTLQVHPGIFFAPRFLCTYSYSLVGLRQETWTLEVGLVARQLYLSARLSQSVTWRGSWMARNPAGGYLHAGYPFFACRFRYRYGCPRSLMHTAIFIRKVTSPRSPSIVGIEVNER